jgi:hypothetical protein
VRALVAILVGLVGALAASAALASLTAKSVSASAGTTAATATYDEVSGSGGTPYANLLLGRGAQLAATLASQERAGWLRSAGGYAPSGEAFIAALQRFLAKYRYAS